MATKKEMVAELVDLGANEAEIKDLKNSELEELLEKAKGEAVPAEQTEPDVEVQEAEAPDEVEQDVTGAEEPEPEAPKDEQESEKVEIEVLRETSQQLGIFSDYIYNVKNKGAKVVIDNLGYGDVYYSDDDLAVVGKSERLTFSQTVTLEGAQRICFTSASQPVVQILEVK